jgi:hypothetical protein
VATWKGIKFISASILKHLYWTIGGLIAVEALGSIIGVGGLKYIGVKTFVFIGFVSKSLLSGKNDNNDSTSLDLIIKNTEKNVDDEESASVHFFKFWNIVFAQILKNFKRKEIDPKKRDVWDAWGLI